MTKLTLLALAPALAALALAASVGAASAENAFQLDPARSTASRVALTNVQADQNGTVEVYAYDEDGKVSRFLGQTKITAGDNGTVEVALNQPSNARLQILMSNGNRAVVTLDAEAPLTN